MKTTLRWLFWIVLVAIIATPFALFFTVLSPTPAVTASAKPSADDIARLTQVMRQHAGSAGAGQREVRLTARDLQLAIDHQLHQQQPPPPVAVAVGLDDGELTADITVKLPLAIRRHYLNLRAAMVPAGNTLKLTRLTAGELPLPGFAVAKVQQGLQAELAAAAPNGVDLTTSISQLAIRNGTLIVDYRSDSSLAQTIAAGQHALLASKIDQQSVSTYLARLGRLAINSGGRLALHTALPELFATATQRMAAGADPATENRSVLAALAYYGADPKLLDLVKLGDTFPRPPITVTLTLHNREDLARHYITSAVLSLVAGTDMADAAGLYKETSDANGKSGFGIADLVADHAGVVLAQIATRDGASARATAEQLAGINSDGQLMPPPDDPRLEAMAQQLASATSGELDSTIANIDRRIDALVKRLPLYARLQQ